MAYALDLLIALLCALTAIPLLMQLRPSTNYRRSLNAEGEPIGGAAGAESAEDRGCGAVASYEGDGVYRIDGVLLDSAGAWTLDFQMTIGEIVETARFDFQLQA